MNPKSFLEELAVYLKALVWPSTTNKIFGDSVFVVAQVPIQQISRYRAPVCFIVDIGQTPYQETTGVFVQNFTLNIWIEQIGSPYSEYAVLDGNRVADQSKGAGAKSLEKVVQKSLQDITRLSGQKIVIIPNAIQQKQFTQNNVPCIMTIMPFQAPHTEIYT